MGSGPTVRFLFDFVGAKGTGYKRIPVAFVEDANGQVVYQSTRDVRCKVLETYEDEASGKTLPREIAYELMFPGSQYQMDTADEPRMYE